jgi:hypothetical protein
MKYIELLMSADLGEMLQKAGLTHFKVLLCGIIMQKMT